MALYFIFKCYRCRDRALALSKKVIKVIVGIPKEIKDATFRSRNSTVNVGVGLIGQHAKKTQG